MIVKGGCKFEIIGLVFDSWVVWFGYLFVVLFGVCVYGGEFIFYVICMGVVVVLIDVEGVCCVVDVFRDWDGVVVVVDDVCVVLVGVVVFWYGV